MAGMKVELISITDRPEDVIENAARTCYQSENKQGRQNVGKLIRKLLASEHESPIEHASATFRINGCSRAMTHQLVRHRLCAFSQKSQRYVSEKSFEYVIPSSISAEDQDDFRNDMETIRLMYKKWKERGLKNEDARFVLPNACTSEIVISANFREFRHIFKMRCSPHAQWEIKKACTLMLHELHKHAPNVFEDIMQAVDKK